VSARSVSPFAPTPAAPRCTPLPRMRGPVSGILLEVLRCPVGMPVELPVVEPTPALLADDDAQLALYLCYELHYGQLEGVDDAWEWDPGLLAFRAVLERAFEAALRAVVPEPPTADPHEIGAALQRLVAEDDGAPLSRYVETSATADQLRELFIHRSGYQLKEADPHSWAIPRLSGAPKAALVEVQADEYGGGRPDRVHAELFAKAMDDLGLDRTYGAYLDHLPGVTLATVNLMSLLGLHRRWRGAIAGHLAAFEMTSSIPNRRYGNALRRLGFGERATDFFDEHVEADAVHENVAAVDLAGGLARQEPALAGDVLWGARALVDVEARWARHLLDAWEDGRSSLLVPLAAVPAA
jgi:heme oxygenase-like protein